ncbi:MAG: RNA 2',3'-cyclic phosphodiesterase [Spirochaetes bacterium]|nr:RNA 2',3'-cyclic phosphodiesterase [Spirochaetota bacterium]
MSEKKLRTFIAVTVPDSVRINLENTAENLIAGLDSRLIRQINLKNLHLTVQFIGDTEPDKIPEIIRIIRDLKIEEPVNLQVTSPGFFLKRNQPAVLWFGISDTSSGLHGIHSRLNEELKKSGLNIYSKNFKPHLTVAYIKPGVNPDLLRRQLDSFKLDYMAFFIREIALFSSILLPAGARHEVLYSRKIEI